MENQVSDITAFLKGMQARLDSQHESLKKSPDANTSTLQDLLNWKPQVQAEVQDLQTSLKDLWVQVEQISQKQIQMSVGKVFDVEHFDLTGSSKKPKVENSPGTETGPLGHGDAQQHRGHGHGVVTTLVPTPVIGAGNSNSLSLIPFALPLSNAYHVDVGQLHMNHVIPLVDLPDFDGSSPKLWVKNCENYFELYAVPEFQKVRIASMHFVSNAAFWVQSLDYSIKDLSWIELCKVVCDQFEKDQHNQLMRQFFHISQQNCVAEYIEKFDALVHQILAHDPKFNSVTITNRFIDGLKD